MPKLRNQEYFLNKVKKIFPEYDFSKAIYVCALSKVQVGCKHGWWWQRPSELYIGRSGCKLCSNEKREKTNIKKYGKRYAIQNESIRSKQEKTLMEKYGVTNPGQIHKK